MSILPLLLVLAADADDSLSKKMLPIYVKAARQHPIDPTVSVGEVILVEDK